MEKPTTIGIDLAKSVFQVHGVDAEGTTLVKRKLRRAQVRKRRLRPTFRRGPGDARPFLS